MYERGVLLINQIVRLFLGELHGFFTVDGLYSPTDFRRDRGIYEFFKLIGAKPGFLVAFATGFVVACRQLPVLRQVSRNHREPLYK